MEAKLSRKGSSVEGYWSLRNGDSKLRKIRKWASPVWASIASLSQPSFAIEQTHQSTDVRLSASQFKVLRKGISLDGWVRCSLGVQPAMAWGWRHGDYGCQAPALGQNGHLRKGPFFWLYSGKFLLLPIPSDLSALTLTYTFSSFSNYPTADLSVHPRTNELTLFKTQSHDL